MQALEAARSEDPIVVTIDVRSAYRIAELLDVLARMPSTPEPVATAAREATGRFTEQLPPLHHRQPWDPPGSGDPNAVTLDDDEVAALREMLLLFETMPSTPGDLVEEARAHEELLEAAAGGLASTAAGRAGRPPPPHQ